MLLRAILTAFVILIFAIFAGCSGGNSLVTLPGHGSDTFSSNTLPVGVSDRFSDGSPASGMGVLGLFNLSVDPVNATAELASLRQTALTDVLEIVDITNFLQMAPCYDCAKIGSVSLDADGNLVVSIGIKHPFPAGDPFKPISGKNRGDLHVFNIEGTIVSNLAGYSFAELGETTAGFTLVNADGYTPYLDTVLDGIYPTDATIHPYILHFDDYTAGNFDASNPMGFASVTDPPPSGNLVMAMGCDYDYQDYVFDIDGTIDFIYAVGCTYAVSSASKNERFNPEYRVPQHNKKAASEVSVEIISNDLEGGDVLSSAVIRVNVVDINHDVAVGENLDEMLADSSVSAITIDAPGIETNILNVDVSSPTGTGHDPSDPLAFGAIMMNTANASEGTYNCLVKVTDSYAPGLNESLLLNGMDGIERVDPLDNPLEGLFDIAEFATYQTFTIDVAETVTSIFVDNSHPGPLYDGTRTNPFDNIQDGIDAAALLVDFEVWVDDSGTPYEEHVNMASDVIVLSVNWDDTDGGDRAFIDGPDDPDTHSVHFDGVDNATLKGFQIGFAGPCGSNDYMEMLSVDGGSNNSIQDCLFTGLTNYAVVDPIIASDTTSLTIAHCRMAGFDKDTSDYGCNYFNGVYANNCPGLTVRNNVFTDIRPTPDGSGKNIYPCYIESSANVVVKNNLVHHITPDASMGFMGAVMISGFHFINCSGAEVINNTVDNLDSSKAFFIQNLAGYFFDSCSNPTFTNNIVTHLDYSGSPPGNDCGVKALYEDLYCDYSCFYDMSQYFAGCPVCTVHEGIGCIFVDPDYNDPSTEDYDVSPTSPAQNGDPSIDDWDGASGSGSRMGCHGGPGGETVGLLT